MAAALALGACSNSATDNSKKGCCKNSGSVTASTTSFGTIDSASANVEILPAPTYPKGSPVDQWGKLKVDTNATGVRCLCSADGKPVQLRGMSSHGLQWKGCANITGANMKALKNDWNANIFRIAVYVDEEGGYAYNHNHRDEYVDNLVKWTAEQGMYLLIDWHVLSPGNPMSAIYRNHPSNGKDLAADFFTYCARRYQNQKHILYELCNEPNKVDGVAGVRFGESKQSVLEKFRGKGTLLTNETNTVTYRNATVGGILYDFVIFYFKYDNAKRTYTLASANLQKSFNTWRQEEGLQMYEQVCGLYRRKYTNERTVDNGREDKLSAYGMCSNDYLEGKVPPIVVSFSKSLSKGGEFYYYVTVNYFQGNLSDMYNDEI